LKSPHHIGWKGLINDPHLDGTYKINDGLRLRAISYRPRRDGRATGTEFLDMISPQYIAARLLGAIGARTSESQVHRQLVSGVSCPVGFKNATSGDVQVALTRCSPPPARTLPRPHASRPVRHLCHRRQPRLPHHSARRRKT